MQDIEIYPASWYYNACVQGFLEVLAWGLGDEGEEIITEQILRSDGRAVIPGNLMTAAFSPRGTPAAVYIREVPEDLPQLKRIGWWWVEKSYEEGFIRKEDRGKLLNAEAKVETVVRSLFHKSANYPNLVQLTWDLNKKLGFINNWFSIGEAEGLDIRCGFCGRKVGIEKGGSVYETSLTRSLSIHIGNGPNVFPNLFWDGLPGLIICKQCRAYFLCFHLVSKNGFFINSDSLLVNWHLNHLLSGKVNGYYHQSLLKAMQYDRQLRGAIGSWGLQNMEELIFERDQVKYYPVSATLARLLLIPGIATLMSQIANNRVWEIILQERFDYLPTVIYKSLRAMLTGENKEKDPEIVFSGHNNAWPVNNLIQLYYAIRQQLAGNKGGAIMGYINLKEIREIARMAPLDLNTNVGKNLVYRLMELTRLNKKTEVYHLLLRSYLTSDTKRQFPVPLARLFETNDHELFKTGIYAFIAGLNRSDINENF
ncbi:hypothetical protein [Moorella sp. Hama-1]|uniref:hypothetical protein n=1 Tax=Moorella sp. Hama-1 TaxID=2138101 RepID=UPI000D64A29A|nr:hypothetical protein [Moorella sp. Hama-1]BCV20316.1 type I-B CRISPR-associated protein Cas8b1/Cst1 [Moorella sp. Hama-1]